MPDDAFLENLRATWRRTAGDEAIDAGAPARLARWRQRTLAAGIIGFALLAACFLGFAWRAFAARDPLQGIAAAAYGLALPAVLAALAATWADSAATPDRSPRGVIEATRVRARLSRRLARSGRWSAIILAAATAALWVLVAADGAAPRAALVLTPAWGGTAALIWLWVARREVHLARIIADCDRLLAEFDSTGD